MVVVPSRGASTGDTRLREFEGNPNLLLIDGQPLFLAALGGLVALLGIENPRRKVPCADCPGGVLAGAPVDAARAGPSAAEDLRQPVPAT